MTLLEMAARAALQRRSLELRSLAQDRIRSTSNWELIAPPQSGDPLVVAMADSPVELLAERAHQSPPAWTKEIGPVPEGIYLVSHENDEKTPRIMRSEFSQASSQAKILCPA